MSSCGKAQTAAWLHLHGFQESPRPFFMAKVFCKSLPTYLRGTKTLQGFDKFAGKWGRGTIRFQIVTALRGGCSQGLKCAGVNPAQTQVGAGHGMLLLLLLLVLLLLLGLLVLLTYYASVHLISITAVVLRIVRMNNRVLKRNMSTNKQRYATIDYKNVTTPTKIGFLDAFVHYCMMPHFPPFSFCSSGAMIWKFHTVSK